MGVVIVVAACHLFVVVILVNHNVVFVGGAAAASNCLLARSVLVDRLVRVCNPGKFGKNSRTALLLPSGRSCDSFKCASAAASHSSNMADFM